MILRHTQGIINSDDNSVVSLCWKGSSHPNLVIPEIRGNERNDLFDVDPLP
jgi:hypothetical protein